MKKLIILLFLTFSVLLFFVSTTSADTGKGSAFIGQWVWSPADAKIFDETRRQIPNLQPCIWTSTIYVSGGKIRQRLANTTDLVGDGCPAAVVIRFDDSFSSKLRKEAPPAVGRELNERLKVLESILAGASITVSEVQLDYDCPVRHLEDWSKIVRILKEGSLNGRDIWITSLPCHIRVPKYGSWFRDCVKGHILQVFDTGVACDNASVLNIAKDLKHQKMPFRMGFGAFERTKGTLSTDHRRWFSVIPAFSSLPGYNGIWVFPAGNQWEDLL